MLGDLELEERESKDSSFICTSTQYFGRLFCGFLFLALLEVIVTSKIESISVVHVDFFCCRDISLDSLCFP